MKLYPGFNTFINFSLYCILHVSIVHAAEVCSKVNNCACELSAGLIDLSPLASGDNKPQFKDVKGDDGTYYSWNPCNPFSEGSNECTNVAGCQTDTTTMYFSLGKQDTAKFITDLTAGLQLQYEASTTDGRSLYVTLVCNNQSSNSTVTAEGENPYGSQMYYMTLTSPYCCPGRTPSGGLSVGSILVIVFSAIVCVYVLGGIGFQVFIRKSSGPEIIPNLWFWSAIPGLISAGVLFTFCCGKRNEYGKI